MQKIDRLEDQSWISGGNRLVSFDTMAPQRRVRSVFLYLELSGTKGAAETVSADLFAKAIKNIRIGNFFNLGGQDLYWLNHAIVGRRFMRGTDIPGSGTTFSIAVSLEIPFRDIRQPGSDDGSIPTELLIGSAMEVTFDTAAIFGGTIVITAGTLRTSAEVVHETNTPQLARIYYIDPNSQTAQLDPGIYKELLLVKTDGSAITTAEVTSIDLDTDGDPVLNNILHQSLLQAWNRYAADGVGSNVELVPGSANFLPLVFHDRGGKSNLSKQVLVDSKGRVQIVAGSLTNYRLIAWKAVGKDEDQVQKIASKIGAPPGATDYEPAVAKPSAGMGDRLQQQGRTASRKQRALYAYLPGKMRVNRGNTRVA